MRADTAATLDRRAWGVSTHTPLWLVVVRGAGAPYVELLTGAEAAPYRLPPVDEWPAAVQAVRHEVTRYLAASPFRFARQARGDVGLCLDEVLANALAHTTSRVITVTAEVLHRKIHHCDAVQVVVGDEARRKPPVLRHRSTASGSEGGRGLVLLDGLADWGHRRLAHGKEVWFRCPTLTPPRDQL